MPTAIPGPLTSLGLQPGVTFLMGGAASGKTAMLATLAEEHAKTSSGQAHVYGDMGELEVRVGPSQSDSAIRLHDGIDRLRSRVRRSEVGGLFLVDDFIYHLGLSGDASSHMTSIGGRYKTWVRILDRDAKQAGVAVVMSVRATPPWVGPHHPVFRLQPNPNLTLGGVV